MLIVISPAKTLDFETAPPTSTSTQPEMLKDSELLIEILREKSSVDIERLMKVSSKIAELNVARYHSWSQPFTVDNAKQAVFAFKGDVYTGLEAETFSTQDLTYAQDHLRILSGLYGVLRPLDLMQPYRLEMGVRLANPEGANLYKFWGSAITEKLNEQLGDSELLLNLASNEYFKSVQIKSLDAKVVTPVFKDWKNGEYKLISFYAKKARGAMSAWVLKNKVDCLEGLTRFDSDGYKYSKELSDELNPVYLRKL